MSVSPEGSATTTLLRFWASGSFIVSLSAGERKLMKTKPAAAGKLSTSFSRYRCPGAPAFSNSPAARVAGAGSGLVLPYPPTRHISLFSPAAFLLTVWTSSQVPRGGTSTWRTSRSSSTDSLNLLFV